MRKNHLPPVLILCILFFKILPLHAIIYYVSTTGSNTAPYDNWTKAATNLQTVLALPALAAGDEIWVAKGTYTPSKDYLNGNPADAKDVTFYVKDGVKLYGGFAGNESALTDRNLKANTTTLDGGGTCYHVVIASAANSSSGGITIDGFTIKNGNASKNNSNVTINGNTFYRNVAGGIYIIKGAINNISNNIISNNTAVCNSAGNGGGAGIHIYNSATLTLNNNAIHDNAFTAGGNGNGAGGGVYIHAASQVVNATITNNDIYNNSGTSSGGGVYINGQTTSTYTISNNFIHDNTISYGGGGGMFSGYGIFTVTNNVFYNNTNTLALASAWAGALMNFGNNGSGCKLILVNNTFYNNSAYNRGCVYINGTPTVRIFNNIFYNNKVNGSTTATGADVEGSGITSCKANYNLLQYSTFSTGISLGGGTSHNVFNNTDPKFFNLTSPYGPDGVINTSDDGFYVKCGSPALGVGGVNATNGVTDVPLTDAVSYTRSTSTTAGQGPTIGAYEQPGAESLPLASGTTTIIKMQAGTVIYGDCSPTLVCTVASTGASPISGSDTAKVWIESTQPPNFVKRHYQISPQNNAATSTGRITLYFTQAEFDEFNSNTLNTVKLPTNSLDAAGIANLLVEKRSGTTNDGTGMPNSYTGSVTTINPADADIVWSDAAARWAVTIDVTGFSGFWVKTVATTLPLKWLNVYGSINSQNRAAIYWKVNETGVKKYEVEKSTDGRNYFSIAWLGSMGDGIHSYEYADTTALQGTVYYRILQTDMDGRSSYSTIIRLSAQTRQTITMYPNPFTDGVIIISNQPQPIQVMNINGAVITSIQLKKGANYVQLNQLAGGIYILKTKDGRSQKLAKY